MIVITKINLRCRWKRKIFLKRPNACRPEKNLVYARTRTRDQALIIDRDPIVLSSGFNFIKIILFLRSNFVETFKIQKWTSKLIWLSLSLVVIWLMNGAGSFSRVIFGESLNCESLKFSFQNMTPGHFKRKISLEIDLQNLNIKKNLKYFWQKNLVKI